MQKTQLVILDFKLSPCSICNMFSFGEVPRCLGSNIRRFGALYRFHLHGQVDAPAHEEGTDRVFRNIGC